MEKSKKWIGKKEALQKLQRYCAYQDRCHQEVRRKLYDLGLYGTEAEEVIVELIEDNFLNEERFACSYARGKFRLKNWGKVRILKELRQREISDYCIRKAIEEIDPDDYLQTLKGLIHKKANSLRGGDLYQRRQKVAVYLINRGFESKLVWERIKSEMPTDTTEEED